MGDFSDEDLAFRAADLYIHELEMRSDDSRLLKLRPHLLSLPVSHGADDV